MKGPERKWLALFVCLFCVLYNSHMTPTYSRWEGQSVADPELSRLGEPTPKLATPTEFIFRKLQWKWKIEPKLKGAASLGSAEWLGHRNVYSSTINNRVFPKLHKSCVSEIFQKLKLPPLGIELTTVTIIGLEVLYLTIMSFLASLRMSDHYKVILYWI